MITAKEAREGIVDGDDFKRVIERADKRIREAMKEESDRAFIDIGDEQHLYDKIRDYFKEKGYDVSWNRALLGFDISW